LLLRLDFFGAASAAGVAAGVLAAAAAFLLLRLDFFAGAASPAAAGAAAASAAAAFLLFFFDLVVALSVWVAVSFVRCVSFLFLLAHAGVVARLSARPAPRPCEQFDCGMVSSRSSSSFSFSMRCPADLPQSTGVGDKVSCEQASRRGPTNKSAHCF